MISRPKSEVPPLGISPEESIPFFSAEYAAAGEHQEQHIFRHEQLQAWKRVNARQMSGRRIGKDDLQAIEPVAVLILRVSEHRFEAMLLGNTDLSARQEAEALIETAGEAFLAPLRRDGKLLVYYTETPYNCEWS